MGARLPVLIVVALSALAGCVGGDEQPAAAAVDPTVPVDAAALPGGGTPDPAAAEAPLWNVGDAWSVTSFGFGEEQRFFLVVTRASADSYTLESTNEQQAGFDAMYDVSFVGNIRARDLAGSQQGTPVQFFDFPLADGKTWSTPWDGYEVMLTATASARGFDIAGTVDGEPYVKYDYVPDMRWWSGIDFVREGYGMKIDRAISNWTGAVVSASAEVVYEGTPAAPIGGPGAASFTLNDGISYGMATLVGGGSHWARAFELVQPDGSPYMGDGIETFEAEAVGPREVFLQMELPPLAGEWRIAAPSIHDPESAFYVTVHAVTLTMREFTG